MAKVLVVEDEAATRRPLAKLLRSEGYEVLTAQNAYAAAGTIRNERPDLILLDVGIPPMDGLTLLMLLRDDPKVGDVPVIVITGHADEHTASRAAELGVKARLIKSQFTPEELLALVREHVRTASPSNPGETGQIR